MPSTAREYAQNLPLSTPNSQPRNNARPQTRKIKLNHLVFTATAMVAFAAAWMVAAKGASIDSLNYQNVNLQVKIQTLSADNASYTAQKDVLATPSHILNVALNELHLLHANPVQIGGTQNGK
jgi:hypothetical protein